MKSWIILVFSLFLYSQTLNDILKQIPESSPNYSLAKILILKTNTLKFEKPVININPKNEKEYLSSFFQLVKLLNLSYNLPKQINELQDKIIILQSQTDPISQIQLQYFQKNLDIKNKILNYISNNFAAFEEKLFNKLHLIKFNNEVAKRNIENLKNQLTKHQQKLEKLKIELQKWKLLNNKKNILITQQEINKTLNNVKKLYKNLLNEELIIWFYELKNKNKSAFKTDDFILEYAKKADSSIYKPLNQIIIDYEKFTFGAKVFVYGAKKELEIFTQKTLNIINYPIFKVGNRTITPLNFAIFILVLIIGWFIGKYYKYIIYRLRHKKNISYSTATLLANMGYYSILTLSFLIALKVVGLDLSSLAIIAGALSVGIGFGLQNVVSNFVSGIILMFERSIKVGDYIQIDQDTRGEVVDISMRSTVIRTNDNINLIIPNQSFIQNNVINWTLGDDIVRFRVPFGVAYGSDIDKVEKVILNAISKANLPYIKKHSTLDTTPLVVFMEMADSSLNFELFVWVKGEYARRPRRTRSEFLKVIYKALNEAGINIPFPQQDLHIKDSVPFEIRIKK
ncbi:mechanosensitive ion channel family protein [Nautilia profundicola AmH]|uniref:Mechanosensitive ion channel family protein n=1 Tax=Nautilia profundicola (strain ATCC BAA-1463 / DSM 18972 / AmH) TaxID=598659 RepID=B9L8Z1_NAUPA|nr:mechanosensitive ion channel domain-containing protein [Nautilia profundicola]ACM92162.1 mechanosensitive ion channel family protein [Nautilia profundicola AmH]